MRGRRTRQLSAAFDRWAPTYHAIADGKINRRGYSYAQLSACVISSLHINGGGDILEVGVGTGLLGTEVAARATGVLHGVDLSVRMLAAADRTGAYATLTRANAERLPFNDGTFAGAFSAFCIHSVSSPETAISELLRVTRPGGVCVVVDLYPESSRPRLAQLRGYLHSLLYECGAPAFYTPVHDFLRRVLSTGSEITLVRRLGIMKSYSHYAIGFSRGKR